MFNLIEWLYLKQKNNLVYYDELTGCRSRRYYDVVVKERYLPVEVLVTFIDVDNLKYINDTEGHIAGSMKIKAVGSQLKNLRGALEVCRIGGDEFLVLGSIDIDELSQVEGISYGSYLKEAHESVSSAVNKSDDRMYTLKIIKRMNMN